MQGATRPIFLRITALFLAGALSACGSAPRHDSTARAGIRVPGINCAPFARELSGIALYGSAESWWDSAAGRYDRGERPALGSVLVFRKSARLRSGHISVVTRLLGPRQIRVTQANWVPSQVDEDQLVVDVSPGNDWSEVRVWYPPVNQLGTHAYPAHGFIHASRPATPEELARAIPAATRYAMDTHGRPPPRARTEAW